MGVKHEIETMNYRGQTSIRGLGSVGALLLRQVQQASLLCLSGRLAKQGERGAQ